MGSGRPNHPSLRGEVTDVEKKLAHPPSSFCELTPPPVSTVDFPHAPRSGADETSGSTEREQEDIIKALKETDTPGAPNKCRISFQFNSKHFPLHHLKTQRKISNEAEDIGLQRNVASRTPIVVGSQKKSTIMYNICIISATFLLLDLT